MERVVVGERISPEDVVAVGRRKVPVELSPEAFSRMEESRRVVEELLEEEPHPREIHREEKVGPVRVQVERIEEGGRIAYGITTGFGELARVRIPREKIRDLQLNLVRSHAVGAGEPFPSEIVRGAILLRAQSLALGRSGVRPILVERLLALLNEDVVPVVPSRGSLGSSGDLIPLAHIALVLVGEGEAWWGGSRLEARKALERAGLSPLTLEAKEGLALVNGTSFMASILSFLVVDGVNLVRNAEIASAISVEVLLGSVRPFDERIVKARPHRGVQETASNLRRLTSGSPLVASHEGCDRVQDAYSLRCLPQVLGAVRGVLHHAREILDVELQSSTDNPLVFPGSSDPIVSNGNFHGEPLALLSSYLQCAFSELASFSERRIARLLDPRLSEGLPPFLTRDPGLSSGLMIAHYLAAALALESQASSFPPAALSLPVSAQQEDHNSNGLLGALGAHSTLRRATTVVAVEMLAALQGADLRLPLELAPATRAVRERVRRVVPFVEKDRPLGRDIEVLAELIRSGELVDVAQSVVGPLE